MQPQTKTMAGPNPPKNSSHKTHQNHNHHHSSSSSSSRKSRFENPDNKKPTSSNPNPNPSPNLNSGQNPNPNPIQPKPTSNPPRPDLGQFPIGPPLPNYGFHMLDRRNIHLADGSVRSYFSLPQDYDFLPRHLRPVGTELPPMSPEMGGDRFFNINSNPMMGGKRKFVVVDEGEERELAWKRQQLLQFGNAGLAPNGGEFLAGPSRDNSSRGGGEDFRMAKQMRLGGGGGGGYNQANPGINRHNEVDQIALKKAFLNFVKLVNENANLKMLYLENGRHGPLNCVICGRVNCTPYALSDDVEYNSAQALARDFPDMHTLIMHTYNPDRADQLVDHLGLHKALCVLMGWNYSRAPDNSRAYQSLSPDEAAKNQDDVILWPPMVVVHNTITGKGKEGRIEGLGNKAMDAKLRELGFASGKAKSVYGKEGHTGITFVKFSADKSGLEEAVRLAEFLEREKRGRKGWARVQPSSTMGKDDENNPNLMELDKRTGEKQRILYGYLGTVFDLDKLDFETRKKIQIETRRDYGLAK